MTDTPEPFKAWLTKDALRRFGGIRAVRGCYEAEGEWLKRDGFFEACGAGQDWHRTREGAIKRAKQMRDARIAALQKQIAKLECMTFEDTPT